MNLILIIISANLLIIYLYFRVWKKEMYDDTDPNDMDTFRNELGIEDINDAFIEAEEENKSNNLLGKIGTMGDDLDVIGEVIRQNTKLLKLLNDRVAVAVTFAGKFEGKLEGVLSALTT